MPKHIVSNRMTIHPSFPKTVLFYGFPFPSPGDLPDPGIGPASPALAGRFFTTELPGKPLLCFIINVLKCPIRGLIMPLITQRI